MPGVVFVFGSNLAGRHGKGAALRARQHWGARPGVGEGRTGDAYALPTKDESLQPLPLEHVREAYVRFTEYAREREAEIFLLTPFGTGLAGFSMEEIKGLVTGVGIPPNVALTASWLLTDVQT